MSEEKKTNRMSRYVETKEEPTPKEEIEKKPKVPKEDKENKEEIQEKQTKKMNPTLKKILITILILIISIIAYTNTIGKTLIEIKEYKVESNIIPDSFHGMKIIHFSDIHYGTTINQKQLNKIVKKINELNPDIIFFTGDLIDTNIANTETIQKEIRESLKKLNDNCYKYAIYGNEDNTDIYNRIIKDAGFTILVDESTLLFYKDDTPIMITGYNDINSKPNYTILTNMIDEIDPTDLYKIVLVHEPDSIDNFIQYNPDLVLAGHSLGGLIDLSITKPMFLPENSKNYYEDYYKLNNTKFYISSGLGTNGINARFNNQPSINFYRLYKTN